MSDLNSKLTQLLPKELDIEVGENDTNVTLYVTPEIDYFRGHFPKASVLPGVVQLDWAIHYARKYLDIAEQTVKNVEVLKFQVIIQPGLKISLQLVKKSDHKFTFKYISELGVHASGRVVLEEE